MSSPKETPKSGFIRETTGDTAAQTREAVRAKIAKDTGRDKGYRKAAEFLVLLGREQAAQVLKHLSETEIQGITREIAQISTIDKKQAEKVLKEFGYLMQTKELVARGGEEKAREILNKAFGSEKGEALLTKILERTVPHPFAFLKDIDAEQVKLLLKDESAVVISVILSHLDHELAAQILKDLDGEKQKEVARRIAKLQKISPEVLNRIQEGLREKIRTQGQIITREIDGKGVLVEILKNMDYRDEQEILGELEQQDPDIAASVKQSLFTIDMIQRLRRKDLQKILHDFSDKELAYVLKGKGQEIYSLLMGNMSRRRQEIIKAESEALGSVWKTDVDKATKDFISYVKEQADAGKIILLEKGDEYID